MAVAVATSSTLSAALIMAPAAIAAGANGYVFNDAWTLTGSSVQTQYSPSSPAHHSAATSLPSRTGTVDVTAQFVPNEDRSPGSTILGNGTNQAAYGGQSAMFIGSPTPADVPALGLYTNGSDGCGGALGTTEHQNFSEQCDVGKLTLTFSKPVTDMVLDISGLGGYSFTGSDGRGSRGSFNSTIWSIATDGVQFTGLPAAATNMKTDGKVLSVVNRNTFTQCNQNQQLNSGTTRATPRTDFAGCGSVILKGTFDTVTFDIASMASPFSMFPTAEYGTGSEYFVNNGTAAFDGVNGNNLTQSERSLTGRPDSSQNSDLQRVSLRLPQMGAIGDRVWNDANGNGVQDAGEAGIQGVMVEL
ncbi:SdrD B-like domain-containing protein, partial [Arthrobacter sp. NPDC090010]|uniref:SdrD B-like domain-containing protein n=1 Tax=Arthrobacter sp. NPDC090010 TaxID=3363942 RepID=UPI00381934D4